jgi:hypothetical protein
MVFSLPHPTPSAGGWIGGKQSSVNLVCVFATKLIRRISVRIDRRPLSSTRTSGSGKAHLFPFRLPNSLTTKVCATARTINATRFLMIEPSMTAPNVQLLNRIDFGAGRTEQAIGREDAQRPPILVSTEISNTPTGVLGETSKVNVTWSSCRPVS